MSTNKEVFDIELYAITEELLVSLKREQATRGRAS